MIVTDAVRRYLDEVRPPPDPLLAEMEAHGARDGVPIVTPEVGEFLQVLAFARGARRIVEVGTAIGVSTLYLARALPEDGELVSFEIDPRRHAAAQGFLERAGLSARVDLRLEDARAGLAGLVGPFDLAFIDGVKAQYGDYLDLLLELLGERGVVAVDNALMSGTVAEGRGDGNWTEDQIVMMRGFIGRTRSLAGFAATLTPVGDGVLVAVRR
jgi:predicted O-methyltransferase YrrM